MFKEYEMGRTPNPDILCNREIKFDVFLKIALELGADYVATGHYCRKDTITVNGNKTFRLLKGKDNNKDQSYFLCQLSQQQLSKTLFPIGELTKPEVRKIANDQDLITANKKDSQGLCFIGKVKLPDFLQQKLKPKEGNIVTIANDSEIFNREIPNFKNKEEELEFFAAKYQYAESDGKIVGRHQGAHYFTNGQRKGLAVGGTKEPLFVINTNVKTNTIYTGEGKNHKGLYRKVLFVKNEEVHFIRKDLFLEDGDKLEVKARIRYRQPLENACIYKVKSGLYVAFKNQQSAITEGQFVAWYIEDELIGSGVIS
jgi:tRNA-specific 2-thiouridylase